VRIADLLSQTVHGLPDAVSSPNPPVSELIEQLGPRSFGIVVVLFGLPNLLPVPGLPMVCGLVIGIIAIQMLIGRDSLALPRWVGDRRVSRENLCRVIDKAEPTLRFMEKLMRPRWTILTDGRAQKAIGLMLLLLAIALMAPIPFFGGIPPGIAVILLGLALVERDGLFVIFGAVCTVAALGIIGLLTYAVLKALILLIA
jgi:hypothetical protein